MMRIEVQPVGSIYWIAPANKVTEPGTNLVRRVSLRPSVESNSTQTLRHAMETLDTDEGL